jgi:TRAP-type C4-dicarboxylate transport system permease small subunit
MFKNFIFAVCGGLSALSLAAMMLLTFFDVMGRKFLDQSIVGSFELTEMLMVVVIFSSLPLVSLRQEHVTFSTLDWMVGPGVRRIQRAAVLAVCGVSLLAVGYVMWFAGVEVGQTGETSAQLLIPRAPFIQLMGVFCFVAGLVELALIPAAIKNPQMLEGGSHV